MTMWHMLIACWITKIISTQSEYVILIAFPMQQWFHESRWILGLYVYYRSNSMFLVAEPLKFSLPFTARKEFRSKPDKFNLRLLNLSRRTSKHL